MISASQELLSISRRWFRAIETRQEPAIVNLLSNDDRLRFVGTASGELWDGQAVREETGRFFLQVPEMLKHEETFGEAYERGDIGWSCFVHELTFANKPDEPVEFRTTLVFALEDGVWKIIHRHGSCPVPNEQSLGVEQTGISALAEAARQEFEMGGRTGLASVMFTDIVSSSTLALTLGDSAWSALINSHFAMIRQVVERLGGQFVKSLGDGTMSVFPTARNSLLAAREIQQELAARTDEPQLAVRIGIHTGDVVQTRNDFFGTVVNTAARIAEGAHGGEIKLSEATRAMVGPNADFQFTEIGSFALRGQETPQTVHRLEIGADG